MNDTILITRPRIAETLKQNGIEVTRVPNPFKPEYSAWKTIRTRKAEDIISQCYAEIKAGKRVKA